MSWLLFVVTVSFGSFAPCISPAVKACTFDSRHDNWYENSIWLRPLTIQAIISLSCIFINQHPDGSLDFPPPERWGVVDIPLLSRLLGAAQW